MMGYCVTLRDRQYSIGTWADKTFSQSTPASVFAHLRREMVELASETDPILRREECADVLMLMLHLAHKEGWSLEDELRRKFEINQQRTWGKPDSEGVVEHVRTEGA